MAFEVKNKKESLIREDYSNFEKNTNEFKSDDFFLELPYGQIKASQWLFEGIKVVHTESQFHKPSEFDWKGDAELVTMHFNLQGKISMHDPQLNQTFMLAANQHNLFYGKEAEGKMKSEELKSKTFLIQFSKEAFLKIAEDGNDAIKRFTERVAGGKSVAFSEENLNIDLNIHNCINAMLNCQFNDSLKRMFFLSKSIELLVLQAESFNRSLKPHSRYLKNDYDKECILFAKEYLLKHIDCPPTLSELAKIAGINEFKLKKGFKETFAQTVFEYLSDVRLGQAKQQLLDGNKTATQIAYELGYCSLHHFSAAFKKKYGMSPKKAFNIKLTK